MMRGPFQKVIKKMLEDQKNQSEELIREKLERQNSKIAVLKNVVNGIAQNIKQSSSVNQQESEKKDISQIFIPQMTRRKIGHDGLSLRMPESFDIMYNKKHEKDSSNAGKSKIMLEQEEYEKMSYIEKKLGTGNCYKQEAILMLVNHIGREHQNDIKKKQQVLAKQKLKELKKQKLISKLELAHNKSEIVDQQNSPMQQAIQNIKNIHGKRMQIEKFSDQQQYPINQSDKDLSIFTNQRQDQQFRNTRFSVDTGAQRNAMNSSLIGFKNNQHQQSKIMTPTSKCIPIFGQTQSAFGIIQTDKRSDNYPRLSQQEQYKIAKRKALRNFCSSSHDLQDQFINIVDDDKFLPNQTKNSFQFNSNSGLSPKSQFSNLSQASPEGTPLRYEEPQTGAQAVKEFEKFNNQKFDLAADQIDPVNSGPSYLTSKAKDKKQMEMLNKYLNYSLMKLNDDFVQSRFKQFLKSKHEKKVKQETVYERLQKNADAKVQEKLIYLSKAYDEPQNQNKSKFLNVSQNRILMLQKKIKSNLNSPQRKCLLGINFPRKSRLHKNSSFANSSHGFEESRMSDLEDEDHELTEITESISVNEDMKVSSHREAQVTTFSEQNQVNSFVNSGAIGNFMQTQNKSFDIQVKTNNESCQDSLFKKRQDFKNQSQIIGSQIAKALLQNQNTANFQDSQFIEQEFEQSSDSQHSKNNQKVSKSRQGSVLINPRSRTSQIIQQNKKQVRIYDPSMEIDKRLDVIERQVISSQVSRRGKNTSQKEVNQKSNYDHDFPNQTSFSFQKQ
eukprot:403338889